MQGKISTRYTNYIEKPHNFSFHELKLCSKLAIITNGKNYLSKISFHHLFTVGAGQREIERGGGGNIHCLQQQYYILSYCITGTDFFFIIFQ